MDDWIESLVKVLFWDFIRSNLKIVWSIFIFMIVTTAIMMFICTTLSS